MTITRLDGELPEEVDHEPVLDCVSVTKAVLASTGIAEEKLRNSYWYPLDIFLLSNSRAHPSCQQAQHSGAVGEHHSCSID